MSSLLPQRMGSAASLAAHRSGSKGLGISQSHAEVTSGRQMGCLTRNFLQEETPEPRAPSTAQFQGVPVDQTGVPNFPALPLALVEGLHP